MEDIVAVNPFAFRRNNDFVKPADYKRVDEIVVPNKLQEKINTSVENSLSRLEYVSTVLNTTDTKNMLNKTVKLLLSKNKDIDIQKKSELLVAQFLAFKIYDVYVKAHMGHDNLIYALEQKYQLDDANLDKFLMLVTSVEAKKIAKDVKAEGTFFKMLKKNYGKEWIV